MYSKAIRQRKIIFTLFAVMCAKKSNGLSKNSNDTNSQDNK